jgi:hypothetical protein
MDYTRAVVSFQLSVVSKKEDPRKAQNEMWVIGGTCNQLSIISAPGMTSKNRSSGAKARLLCRLYAGAEAPPPKEKGFFQSPGDFALKNHFSIKLKARKFWSASVSPGRSELKTQD